MSFYTNSPSSHLPGFMGRLWIGCYKAADGSSGLILIFLLLLLQEANYTAFLPPPLLSESREESPVVFH